MVDGKTFFEEKMEVENKNTFLFKSKSTFTLFLSSKAIFFRTTSSNIILSSD